MSNTRKKMAAFVSVIFYLLLVKNIDKADAWQVKGIEITPKTSISETFDDNITFLKNDKESDFITAIEAGLKARYEGQLKSFTLEGSVTQQLFADHSSFDNTSEELALEADFELSKKDRISLKDSFSHLYEPKSFQESFGRTLGRYSYYVNKFALEYIRELTKQTALKIYYSSELNQFARDDLGDSQAQGIGCAFDYSLSSTTTLSLFYDLAYREFDPGRHALIHSFSTGVKQYFTKQVYATLQAGAGVIEAYSDKTFAKPFMRASLVDELNATTTVKLLLSKEHSLTPYVEDIFDNWDINLNFSKQLKKNLSGYFEVFQGKGKYVVSQTKDQLYGGRCGLTVDLRKHMTFDIGYSAEMVNSNEDARDYKRNTVTAGLNYEF